VDWARDSHGNRGEPVIACYPTRNENGMSSKRPGYISEDSVTKTETMMFSDLPVRALVYLFEDDTQALLERLPIGSILAFGKDGLESDGYPLAVGEYCCKSCEQFMADVDSVNDSLITEGADDGDKDNEYARWKEAMYSPQPYIPPVADHIFYNYDFGDDWCVRIPGSHNCVDMVKQGRVKQEEIDDALKLYIKKGFPSCIARDGVNVIDDVGGVGGFVEFLETINGEDESEKESMLEWASGMGWSKRKVSPKNVL